jgi:hypothetical protein
VQELLSSTYRAAYVTSAVLIVGDDLARDRLGHFGPVTDPFRVGLATGTARM